MSNPKICSVYTATYSSGSRRLGPSLHVTADGARTICGRYDVAAEQNDPIERAAYRVGCAACLRKVEAVRS